MVLTPRFAGNWAPSPSLMFTFFVLVSVLIGIKSDVQYRFHEESEARSHITRPPMANATPGIEYDVISLENFIRNYRHGPNNDRYVQFNHDLIAAYVGPFPKGHPPATDFEIAKGTIRTWAMFDAKTRRYCDLNAAYDWGQLALFSCPHEGLYRAYAIEHDIVSGIPTPFLPTQKTSGKQVLAWTSRNQRELYDLISGQDDRVSIFNLPQSRDKVTVPEDRVEAMSLWILGEPYRFMDLQGQQVKLDPEDMVVSDPIRVKQSPYCYYWMYNLREIAREGYVGSQLIYSTEEITLANAHTRSLWKAFILLELTIWIAEPSAIGFRETLETSTEIEVAEYSKVITKRFSKAGLFPCLKKAHSSIEVINEIAYISEVDPSSKLFETPHWRAIIKIHTDRLISTLSDIEFTIASRQNTASFHCFVGDTRVYYRLRDFEFVPVRKLQAEDVNLAVSNLDEKNTRDFRFGRLNVFGHGIHWIGNKFSKRYQPASNRTDMSVITNPCIAQEFAFAVGGSLYLAEGLLAKGTEQAKKVAHPFFIIKDQQSKTDILKTGDEYLRAFDVAFTPTHAVFLMSDGYLILHPSSIKKMGLAAISVTMKYRLDGFAKRRWCPRTVSHKLSSLLLPIYSSTGNIIILQIYPTEGNVPIWLMTASSSCHPEAAGFVRKEHQQLHLINETDIHYDEFAAVVRTNHKTGLAEPPVPPRPPRPPPPARNIFEETAFIMDSAGNFVDEGEDPHFPQELIDPASHALEHSILEYNQAKIYEVEKEKNGLETILKNNGLNPNDVAIAGMEFTSAEKQFLIALTFKAAEINTVLTNHQESFQAIFTSLTLPSYPYRVKIFKDETGTGDNAEKLDYYAPFPGGIFIRQQAFKGKFTQSRDAKENEEHSQELQGQTSMPFVPEVYTLGTAIPSFVINLGDILVYNSIENRYARPIHYYSWDVLDEAQIKEKAGLDNRPLLFTNSSIKIVQDDGTFYDTVVTEQGMVSVLRRKRRRHLVQDDAECIRTPDTETQRVIMGSVLTLEALREVKPFFRNDNIFQRGTPDGEIIYGVYDVKPASPFRNCPLNSTRDDTKDDLEACVEQATETSSKVLIPVCTKEVNAIDSPCRDPGYIEDCDPAVPPDPKHACLRKNKACQEKEKQGRADEEFDRPVANSTNCDMEDTLVTKCLPNHAPREEIRTIQILGTSYHSYLEGSLEDVKSIHPESLPWEDEDRRQEPDICPFASFRIYHQQLDFAEVGYQTRVTGEISYFGTGIPTEADLLVQFERHVGIIITVSSSVQEERHLTTIRKTVDIEFKMTDYMLQHLLDFNPAEKHNTRQNKFEFEDVRAREPFSVFSVTLRPSIVNTRCKNSDYFKTIQFNVGCNAFSSMRLLSEATPLKRINWTEYLDDTGVRWHKNEENWTLSLPKEHIYYKQVRSRIFNCDATHCEIPYYHLFQNEIYTISYRDPLVPKFEEFLTVSSRQVTGNVVLYDMLGSKEFNWTLNKLDAGCFNTEHFWYDKLLDGTKEIGRETFEHENLYLYYKDCFSQDESQGEREQSQNLYVSPFYFFNKTNKNTIKFLRKRNQLFIFRAVVLNTYYNRFTYCKYLDTYFMVRVTGIPIPRQGLTLWLYTAILLFVLLCLIVSYIFFSKFYSGISTAI